MKVLRFFSLMLALTLIPLSVFAASSISISPGSPSKSVGGTVQFTAGVKGLTPTTVTWSAGGVAGGNATVGVISSSGLYTAPATVPAQNPVAITATSTVNTAISGTTSITVLLEGPKISTFAPAAIPPGAFTITLAGARFAAGAIVQANYGSGVVNLTPTSVTSSQIVVSGNDGAATSATFKVQTPGSAWSNTITVPVAASVAVSPPTASKAVLGTVQFSATSLGLSPSTVTWSVGGIAGGNSTMGTISSSGLYTAPAAVPTVNPVIVRATSTANSAISGSAAVTILLIGPKLTSILPASVPPGAFTLTLSGARFGTGAIVQESSGGVTVNLTPTSITASTIVVSGSQGPAATASFKVQNPGSAWSNALTFPVSASVAVSPTSPTIVVGSGTIQFSAAAYGLSPSTVVWSAGGVVGGNASAGTISSSGLYTAPSTIPGQDPVAITATSTANSAYAATTYVDILSPGPKLTSIDPKTLSVGTITVTFTGTGFLPGAQVLETSGSTQATLSNTSLTSTQIVVSEYQAPATSASFKVKNPGTGWSNTITIPVSSGSSTGGGSTGGSTTGGPATYSLTVNGGTGSGSYAAGTVVNVTAGSPPAGKSFIDWTGATVADATDASTTITMPAAATTLTANFAPVIPPPVPFPVSGHPRLWITPADVTRLRAWATSTNPVWQGLNSVINEGVYVYNTYYFPGGTPSNPYADPGDTQGYATLGTATNLPASSEEWAFVLAFGAQVDPNAQNRIRDAQYARNLLMYALNVAAQGPSAGQPFRDPLFPVYNRANATGHEWGLIVDWIYNAVDGSGNPILTAVDKATIQKVFMMWAGECENAYTTGGDHPSPTEVLNNLALLPNNKPYRMASNNYYLGHARMMTIMGLALDPSDDPPVNPATPSQVIGNTLRSYLGEANGAWLYQEYAMMGDPQTVAAAYNVPNNPAGSGFGLASGGLPPEGMLYGHSFGFVLGQLLALQTAGFNNTTYTGPQAGLIRAPVWDRFVTGFMSSLTPASFVPPSETYLGSVYEQAAYGDLLRLWVTPDAMEPFALKSLLDNENGVTQNDNACRWFAINAVPGGASGYMNNITDPYSWGVTQSVLYFMLLNPNSPTATDPRPSFPTLFYDAPEARIIAHKDWTQPGTFFDYKATWITINHQVGNGGQFEFFRNGEWLTKEMSNYDNNGYGNTPEFHNTISLQNWCAQGTPNLQFYETGIWALGGQFMEGLNAGDPSTIMSNGSNYVYASSDLTNLYNRPDIFTPTAGAVDVTQANRSILWLNNDDIVIYDRGTTVHPNLFKRFSLDFITNPAINGNVATETLPSGQKLYSQTLLPTNAALSSAQTDTLLSPVADLEPTRYSLTVQDPTNPPDTRFLHVLEGANSNVAMVPATYTQSTSGVPFDGAVFGYSAVFFPFSATTAFTGTTITVPNTVTQLMVVMGGLSAGAAYSVGEQTVGSNKVISIAPAASGTNADSAGLLVIAP